LFNEKTVLYIRHAFTVAELLLVEEEAQEERDQRKNKGRGKKKKKTQLQKINLPSVLLAPVFLCL